MIEIKVGNLFNSHAQTYVNTVNCVGVMGAGIALEFKKRFPDMHNEYLNLCERGEVKLGEPYLYRSLIPPWILNFPTKNHWRSVSKLEDIITGLKFLKAHYKEWDITSIAVPPLGCGYGQLEWRIVGPTLYRYLKDLDIQIELYAPFGTPDEELQASFLDYVDNLSDNKAIPFRIEPSWFAIVAILNSLESEPFHRAVGRIIFQKIAYFATESGIPTGLKFTRSSFGPYSSELKKGISALVNNGLIQEEKLGRMFAVRVGPAFEDAISVYSKDITKWQYVIEHVADLFMRVDTKKAEIAATVHFAAKEIKGTTNEKPSEIDILKAVMKWKEKHRPPLSEKDVAQSIRNLNELNWIDAHFDSDLPIKESEFADIY